jgi:hypothetical protein
VATSIFPFAIGSIPRVNDESLTTSDFADGLLSYKRDASLEMASQNQDRPANNMNMGDQKYEVELRSASFDMLAQKTILAGSFSNSGYGVYDGFASKCQTVISARARFYRSGAANT